MGYFSHVVGNCSWKKSGNSEEVSDGRAWTATARAGLSRLAGAFAILSRYSPLTCAITTTGSSLERTRFHRKESVGNGASKKWTGSWNRNWWQMEKFWRGGGDRRQFSSPVVIYRKRTNAFSRIKRDLLKNAKANIWGRGSRAPPHLNPPLIAIFQLFFRIWGLIKIPPVLCLARIISIVFEFGEFSQNSAHPGVAV